MAVLSNAKTGRSCRIRILWPENQLASRKMWRGALKWSQESLGKEYPCRNMYLWKRVYWLVFFQDLAILALGLQTFRRNLLHAQCIVHIRPHYQFNRGNKFQSTSSHFWGVPNKVELHGKSFHYINPQTVSATRWKIARAISCGHDRLCLADAPSKAFPRNPS